jgi:hypothetical protein
VKTKLHILNLDLFLGNDICLILPGSDPNNEEGKQLILCSVLCANLGCSAGIFSAFLTYVGVSKHFPS